MERYCLSWQKKKGRKGNPLPPYLETDRKCLKLKNATKAMCSNGGNHQNNQLKKAEVLTSRKKIEKYAGHS